jgi:hypothetical protein
MLFYFEEEEKKRKEFLFNIRRWQHHEYVPIFSYKYSFFSVG